MQLRIKIIDIFKHYVSYTTYLKISETIISHSRFSLSKNAAGLSE